MISLLTYVGQVPYLSIVLLKGDISFHVLLIPFQNPHIPGITLANVAREKKTTQFGVLHFFSVIILQSYNLKSFHFPMAVIATVLQTLYSTSLSHRYVIQLSSFLLHVKQCDIFQFAVVSKLLHFNLQFLSFFFSFCFFLITFRYRPFICLFNSFIQDIILG